MNSLREEITAARIELQRQVYLQEEPENKKYYEYLSGSILQARKIINQRSSEQRLRKAPFDIEKMRFLRQISVPLQPMHDVLVAFFLLLGEFEGKTRVYSQYTRVNK